MTGGGDVASWDASTPLGCMITVTLVCTVSRTLVSTSVRSCVGSSSDCLVSFRVCTWYVFFSPSCQQPPTAMRAAPAPPELRSATGYVMQPVARTMPGDVISPVHNQAVYRHGTGRPSMVGENGHRTTLPTQLRTPRTANAGHVMRPAARTIPGDVMSLGHDPTVCRHDTSYAGMVRENGPRTTLPLLLRGLVPERVPGLSDRVVRSVSKTIVDLQRVMLDYRAGRLQAPDRR